MTTMEAVTTTLCVTIYQEVSSVHAETTTSVMDSPANVSGSCLVFA